VKQSKDPHAIKSPFQKEVYNASRSVKTQDFKTGEFQGKKKGFFGGGDKYKAGSYSQADKASRVSGETYARADDKSKIGGSTYKTPQSRFEGTVNRNAGKTSTMADDKFDTDGNPEALRGTSDFKRPVVMKDEPSYSEALIKKLLNKS
jgi:hypothetical protein